MVIVIAAIVITEVVLVYLLLRIEGGGVINYPWNREKKVPPTKDYWYSRSVTTRKRAMVYHAFESSSIPGVFIIVCFILIPQYTAEILSYTWWLIVGAFGVGIIDGINKDRYTKLNVDDKIELK